MHFIASTCREEARDEGLLTMKHGKREMASLYGMLYNILLT